jgi:hypothetical protein
MLLNAPTHPWLKKLSLCYIPGHATVMAERVASDLISYFQIKGHDTETIPSEKTKVILTTARFGEPLDWRDSLMFTARRRYKLKHAPMVFTIVHAEPGQFNEWTLKIQRMLHDGSEQHLGFAGISETANRILYQQGKRGGAILYLLRVLQIQTKCIRVLLVVGKDQPQSAFLFDLVGAHPRIKFEDADYFYRDLATRIMTAASTREITNHQTIEPQIKRQEWNKLQTIQEMIRASQELGKRDFFTEMIHVSAVTEIPGFSDVISQQYSEGCFATWDPQINALLTTITGSARPVRKENITDKDLALVAGLKPELDGALIRKIEGHPNYPPSSEAVEMIGMDLHLPKIFLEGGKKAPVIRSKLHGHRGVKSFDQNRIEYVAVSESYQHYPVSCSTEAQYQAVQEAFSRSAALQNPADPRQIVFTVLPGHGVVIVEKWVNGKQAFQVIWEAIDHKDIEIFNYVPQGPFGFEYTGQRLHIDINSDPLELEYSSSDEN